MSPQVAILWYSQDDDVLACVDFIWYRILDMFHLALCAQAAYTYIVTGYGDLASLATIAW